MEAGIFAWEFYEELVERAQKDASTHEKSSLDVFLEKTYGPSTIITDNQKHQEAVSKVQEIKTKQEAETATLGRTFMRDANGANAFSKLSRYETAIERSLYKALHELQRLQAARGAGGNVSLPMAVDVDVSGDSREGL